MTRPAVEVISAALAEQGAAYPNAGAELIMAALRAARIELVQLPEPDEDGHWRIDGTDLEVRLAQHSAGEGPELQVWFSSPTRPSRISKGYDVSVGSDLAAAVLAAVSMERSVSE